MGEKASIQEKILKVKTTAAKVIETNKAKQNDTYKKLEEKCTRLEENQKGSDKTNVKKYESKIKMKEQEVAKLKEHMKTSKTQITELLGNLKRKDAMINTSEEKVEQLEITIKTNQEKIEKLEAFDKIKETKQNGGSEVKVLEEALREKENIHIKAIAESNEKVKIIAEQLNQAKTKMGKLQQIVKALENNLETANDAKTLSESLEEDAKSKLQDVERKLTDSQTGVTEAKQKLDKSEVDRKDTVARCTELETKLSEGETKVAEAEVKMAEAEKVEEEAEEVRRACEAHTERFEHAVSNENGNLYKINYLKEQIRLMTYKCEETEKKHSTMEEQMKEEVEKSVKLDKTRNELQQTTSAEIKGLEKANAKLQEELEKVSTVDKLQKQQKMLILKRFEAELETTKICLEKSKVSVLQPVKDEFEAEELDAQEF